MGSMVQAAGSQPRSREFGLHHALGFSLGAHALLLVAIFVLSLFQPDDVPIPADPPLLNFTFNRGPEVAEPNETPRGSVPDPTPPPQPESAAVSNPRPSGSQPSLATPPPRPAREAAPAVRETAERRDRPAEPTDDRPGLDARERDDAEVSRGAPAPSRRVPERPTPDLDVREALRDYQQALERARASQPQSAAGASGKSVFVPDMSSMPVQGTPYGILEFSSRDYDWSDYYRQIYWEILKAWYRRMSMTTADFEKWARQNEWILNHQNRISFVIHRSGNVSDIVLETPSGCVPLDDSAMDGLSEVILVPLPADFPRESELVRATFIASGEIATMRRYFGYLKSINFF